MRRPLIGIALCFLTGTWLGFHLHLSVAGLGAAFALLALTALACLHQRPRTPATPAAQTAPRFRPRRALGCASVCLCTLLAGWISAQTHLERTLRPAPHGPQPEAPWNVEVVGRVLGEPELAAMREWHAVWHFPLELHKIRDHDGTWIHRAGPLHIRWSGAVPKAAATTQHVADPLPAYGETWRMTGRFHARGRGSAARSGYTLATAQRLSACLSQGRLHTPARTLLRARRAAARLLSVGIEDHPETTGLLHALLLGYRRELSRDTHALFAATGTLHIFAISGLHVGILCGLLIFLLSACGIPRTRWIFYLAPLLIGYTFATGAKASAVRACIMALIYFAAPFLGRKADSLSALALAAILIVAATPSQLFQLGFILSFTVVLGLIVLYPLVHRGIAAAVGCAASATDAQGEAILPLFWEKDPAQIDADPARIRIPRSLARQLVSLAALSGAAWAASAPLTAYYFGRFSPVALLGNILVIPLAFLIVLTGCLSLCLGACVTLLADIFNHANLVLVHLLISSMRWIGALPGGSIALSTVPLWAVALWYAVLAFGVGCAHNVERPKMIDNPSRAWDADAGS